MLTYSFFLKERFCRHISRLVGTNSDLGDGHGTEMSPCGARPDIGLINIVVAVPASSSGDVETSLEVTTNER